MDYSLATRIEPTWDAFPPALRNLVHLLWTEGFEPYEASLGDSFDPDDEPYVYMRCSASNMVAESHRLVTVLRWHGIITPPYAVWADYDPTTGEAELNIAGITDADLAPPGLERRFDDSCNTADRR